MRHSPQAQWKASSIASCSNHQCTLLSKRPLVSALQAALTHCPKFGHVSLELGSAAPAKRRMPLLWKVLRASSSRRCPLTSLWDPAEALIWQYSTAPSRLRSGRLVLGAQSHIKYECCKTRKLACQLLCHAQLQPPQCSSAGCIPTQITPCHCTHC